MANLHILPYMYPFISELFSILGDNKSAISYCRAAIDCFHYRAKKNPELVEYETQAHVLMLIIALRMRDKAGGISYCKFHSDLIPKEKRCEYIDSFMCLKSGQMGDFKRWIAEVKEPSSLQYLLCVSDYEYECAIRSAVKLMKMSRRKAKRMITLGQPTGYFEA
ncbi:MULTISPECIES: hypothetical protein [Vibrio]|uniref:hypothetical protein n=1 Tax=Vibrio TaxID=662 RepID=UPI00078BF005|nr:MULTISPECIES: hypothetical protein [Vibrio]BAU71041.1 hypothetical protein [Vibrio sp. 04Ya108]BBM67697.1 hypothetical protein VA249_43430 [Vibrio alfacsensis]BCN27194.1 hypothetical protein VYA_43860 [Vibrio alfacsensis]